MANIHLHIEPNQPPLTWSQFIHSKPPYSIALDGYVFGSTKFFNNQNGPYANFNHHEEVDRLSTRATCAQVLIALRQGLMDAFTKDNEINIHVYVNDCDQDVCLSWFIINNHVLCQNPINPNINRLVHMEDMMDTCSGSYPFPLDLPMMNQISWIFEPYTLFRMKGGVDRKNDKEFEVVILNVEQRINQYLIGNSGKSNLDIAYRKIGGGPNWTMVIEDGFNARSAMMTAGIKAFVSVRNREDGMYTYSIGKISNYVPFDIEAILKIIDKEENNDVDHWGGSNTIGGSPRVSGSKLSPKKIEQIINDYLYTLI